MDADYDEFFRSHYAPLVRAVAVAAGDEEAADAVQDAFLEAHRRWGWLINEASKSGLSFDMSQNFLVCKEFGFVTSRAIERHFF
jgi:hypothetical protein